MLQPDEAFQFPDAGGVARFPQGPGLDLADVPSVDVVRSNASVTQSRANSELGITRDILMSRHGFYDEPKPEIGFLDNAFVE